MQQLQHQQALINNTHTQSTFEYLMQQQQHVIALTEHSSLKPTPEGNPGRSGFQSQDKLVEGTTLSGSIQSQPGGHRECGINQ
jgi:hypothetical protein